MAQNITLMGASYSDVPAVLLPKTGGGTVQFDDTTDADATAEDIYQGKTAYVNGLKLTGTATGGGGSGGSITQDQDGYLVLSPFGSGGDSEQAEAVISYSLTQTGTIPDLEWTIPDNVAPNLDNVPLVNNLTLHGSTGVIAFNQNLSENIRGVLNFPDLVKISGSNWSYTTPRVTCIYIPNVTNVGMNFFQASSVPNLVKMVIGTNPISNVVASLRGTTALKALVMKGITSVPNLTGLNWSTNSGLRTLNDAYIYVPRSLVTSFEEATNWSVFQFRAIEDYPLIDAPNTWLPTEE